MLRGNEEGRPMDTMLTALRFVHVAAGFAALGLAPIAMATVKGGPAHRRWGKVYYRAMAVVASSAVVLGLARPNLFLTMIAVFSFYSAFSGYRVLSRKRPELTPPALLDWAMASLTLVVSLGLVVLGLLAPSPTWRAVGTVSVTLGVLGTLLSGRDLYAFVRPPADPMAWWASHMGGMLGSYIAVMTAFSVVNFTFLPLTVRWLWPSGIGTPLIALWIASGSRRLRRADRPPARPDTIPA
jgi:hypothetical protein